MRLPTNLITPLGVSEYGGQPALLYGSKRRGHNKLSLARSEDGAHFYESNDAPVILTSSYKSEEVTKTNNYRFSDIAHEKLLTYSKSDRLTIARQEHIADDWDVAFWRTVRTRTPRARGGMFVPEFKHNGHYVLYYNTSSINVALSKDLVSWHTPSEPLLQPRKNHFDSRGLRIVSVGMVRKGILVLYESKSSYKRRQTIAVGAALFESHNPSQLIWRSEGPLWQAEASGADLLHTIGGLIDDSQILLYVSSRKHGLMVVDLPSPLAVDEVHVNKRMILKRHHKNPIIAPENGQYWESAGTFNPATVVHNGHVHMFYRAMAPDGVSRFGYARSHDGFHFDRDTDVAYDHEVSFSPPRNMPRRHSPDLYASGGSWGGSEDPRAVIIDDHVYMSFCVFENWQSMRQAVTVLPVEQLMERNWKWKQPLLISPKGQRQKNWMIFPEKINGKFAILHALSPNVTIDYVDSFEELVNNPIHSPIQGDSDRIGRNGKWDAFLRGASAPPIKTKYGWLLFYQAMNPLVSDIGYKLGAMLLDLEDPTQIIARTSHPILVPSVWYENEHKAGVVYASGAVVKEDELFVYYGGGDRHVCVATAPLDEFLEALRHDQGLDVEPEEVSIKLSRP